MSQLHCYVADELAEKFRKKAQQANLPVSKYLAMLVRKEVDTQWPEDYFDCFGGWQGDPLQREDQGDYEQRAQL